MVVWTWGDRGVEVNGKQFNFIGVTPPQVNQYLDLYNRAREVLNILLSARKCFEVGHASYRDSSRNLADLVMEIDKSEVGLGKTALDVMAFFEPSGMHDQFKASPEQLPKFIDEAVSRLAKYGG